VPLSPAATIETGIIGAEVLYAFRRELAEKLGDVLLRRSMVGMGPRVGLDVDEAAARVAVKHLGWSQERADREVREFRDYVRRYKPRDLREGELTKA
jgi:glycerol-3-phosphate dehydrogenase